MANQKARVNAEFHFRYTAYDASALGLIAQFSTRIDCSRLLGNLSPPARKIAENFLDIAKGDEPRHPEAEESRKALLAWLRQK